MIIKTTEEIFDYFKKWLYQTNSDDFVKHKNYEWVRTDLLIKKLKTIKMDKVGEHKLRDIIEALKPIKKGGY